MIQNAPFMTFSDAFRRQRLRKEVRLRRQLLTPAEQQQAAEDAKEHALNFAPVIQAQTLALFLSFDGELDTHPLISALWHAGKTVCLPVLHPFSSGNLLFLHYSPETILHRNHLKIMEPVLHAGHIIPLSQIDVLMTPLVAFDDQGQRLGMGGGFYDRTLQHWQRYGCYPVGLAHDCQQVADIPTATWDIPLPAIITPSRVWQWPNSAERMA